MGWRDWFQKPVAPPPPPRPPSPPTPEPAERGELFARAFRHGEKLGEATIEVRQIAALHVTSGKIVACDPLVFPDSSPFTTLVPAGDHPVVVAIDSRGDDERIACAKLQWSDAEPTSWLIALVDGQDPATLKDGEYFGYGVDAGLGCFMDADAAQLYTRRLNENLDDVSFNYFDHVLQRELEVNYKHTRDWCDHRPVAGDPRNVIIFSSGLGDGFYPSYFGIAGGVPVCLVTDFLLLA
jgi:hypothetical protein